MFYSAVKCISFSLLKVCFRLKVEGLENLPKKSNFIVVSNHVSFLDPFIIGAAFPEKIHWISLKSFYGFSFMNWFLKNLGTLPTGGASSEKAVISLRNNKNIGLFPEGTRTFDGKLKEFRRGAALLALKTGRPVIPCAILGAYEAFPRSAKFPKFCPIKVKIGKPKYVLKEFDEIIDDICLQENTLKIKNSIMEMIHAG